MERLHGIPDPMNERQKALHDRIASGPRGRVAGPLAIWLRSPDLAERAQALGEHLRFNNVFPKHLSEMAILMVAAHHRCEYEWHVHAPIAAREGLPKQVIAALQAHRRPEDLADDAAVLYDFVQALLLEHRVGDALYARFIRVFGDVALVELTALLGYYQMGAHLLNAVNLNAPDGGPYFAD